MHSYQKLQLRLKRDHVINDIIMLIYEIVESRLLTQSLMRDRLQGSPIMKESLSKKKTSHYTLYFLPSIIILKTISFSIISFLL